MLDGATHAELGQLNLPLIGSVTTGPLTGVTYLNRDFSSVTVVEGTNSG